MLFVALIHVASLGADQLSLGSTFPPNSSIVLFTLEWISGQKREGSGVSVSVEEGEDDIVDEEEEKIPLSVSVVENSSLSLSSGGRRMPSARR